MERSGLLPPVTDACPADLRRVIVAWNAGRVSGDDLREAGFAAALDLLDAYRHVPAPTMPSAVQKFQGLSWKERKEWSREERDQHYLDHKGYYDQACAVQGLNRSHRRWLLEVLAWATAKGLPESVQASIRRVLVSHESESQSDPGDAW